MKYVHNFNTQAEHDAVYSGVEYEEPWAAYVKENGNVTYNEIWLRVPVYQNPGVEGDPWTQKELDIFSEFFEIFKPKGFDLDNARTGNRYEINVTENIVMYRVGGIVDGFNKGDKETWDLKLENVRDAVLEYRNTTYLIMYFTCDVTTNEAETYEDYFALEIAYDFENNKMNSLGIN